MPPARRLAERIGLPWPSLVEIACEPTGRREQRFALRHYRQRPDWLTEDYAVFALRLVARRLGAETVTRSAYNAEAERVLAHGRGAAALALPNADQIVTLLRGWTRALRLARLAPVSKSSPGGERAPSIIELLDLCFEAHGTQPTVSELEVFARAKNLPHGRRDKPWQDYLDDWKAARRERVLRFQTALRRKRYARTTRHRFLDSPERAREGSTPGGPMIALRRSPATSPISSRARGRACSASTTGSAGTPTSACLGVRRSSGMAAGATRSRRPVAKPA
jgi:hypothetical protein